MKIRKNLSLRADYLMNNPEIDAVFGLTRYINRKGQVRKIRGENLNKIEMALKFLKANTETPFCGMSFMYHAGVFKKVGVFDETNFRSEGGEFILRLLLSHCKIGFMDTPVYNYISLSRSCFKLFKPTICQYRNKLQVIKKYTSGWQRYSLYIGNTLFLPVRVLHKMFYFSKSKQPKKK